MANHAEHRRGPVFALMAAALFGVSPVLAKPVVDGLHPALIAGLLYLGSGIGLSLPVFREPKKALAGLAGLSKKHRLTLAGAIISGGVLAPLCLALGIKLASAFEVSLLLNLETVATTVLAWLVFKEHVSREVWLGKALLVAGAVFLSFTPQGGFSAAGLWVGLACALWGLDNNLTRELESLDPTVLAWLKGMAAGLFNIAAAYLLGGFACGAGSAAALLAIGAVSYGISLILFIKSLRHIGASRTSTYFSAGPFFGLIFAVLLLGERPSTAQWFSSVVMATGLWALYHENHRHKHAHAPETHMHTHTHDDLHHAHTHQDIAPGAEHIHAHTHAPLVHTHAHFPDTHHRHSH